ncbi:MAG: Ig-like domain-containing protein [Gallionella sp.]|nr:Ig-like domain-containing protein [Gallionella sp.]
MKTGRLPFAILLLAISALQIGCNQGGGAPASPTLTSVAVTPATGVATSGTSLQFTATGTYSDNSTKNITSTVAWSSSDTAVATVTASGVASANSAGAAVITAAAGSVAGNATFTVLGAAGAQADLLYSFYAGHDALGLDTNNLGQVFTIARSDLGLNYLKINFRWVKIQPNSMGEFDWTLPDQVAAYAEANGLSIIPFLPQEGTPLWAQNRTPAVNPSSCAQGLTFITKDANYYANYVRQFVSRYKSRMFIRYIELENEPNAICLWPDTAQFLAQTDNAAFAAVKGVDPAIRVCSASFHQPQGFPMDASGYPTNLPGDHAYSEQFLKDYLTHLDKGFDCFSLHDYGRIGFTETDPVYPYSSQYDLESNYRTILDQYGFQNTSIVYTECPHEPSMFGGNENYAAAQLAQGYLLSHAKGIAQGRFCQAITKGPTNVGYGVTDLSGATPVYYAGYYTFQTLRKVMTNYPKHAQHVAGLVNDNGYWVEKFTDAAGVKSVYAAFVPIRFDTAKGRPKTMPPAAQLATINIGTNKSAKITTMKGTVTTTTSDNAGNISLQVSAEPVYIEVP